MLLPAPSSAQVVQSGYTSIVAANSAKCLDINGGSSAAGAAAIQWHCNGGENEAWTVQPYSTGEFRIIVQFTGDCLVVSGGSTSSGASIVQEPCTGTNSELWSFVASGSNYEFVNKNSGQCASVSGASTADAAYIVQEPCSTAPSSLWAFTSGLVTPASLSVAQAAHSGQCLNVSGSSSKAGGIIIQWPCSGSPNEQWYMIPSGSHYMLEAHNSSLCLSNNGSTAQNAQLVQETCSTSNNDLWTLKPVGGSYEIIGANGGLCAEVTAASQTAAADVIQATCSAALNQLWSLSPATIPSSWTAVQPLPVDPIAVGNLPDGQLVMWSANDEYSFEGDIGDGNGQTYTATYDPVANVASEVLVTNTGDDMFCPGTANLFDGTILVNGGDSSPKTSLYSPASGLWTSDALMNIPRGYEGDTVLTNGSVLTLGGSWSGGQGGKTAEVWTRGSGWKVLSGVPETTIIGPDPAGVYRGDNHLWLFSAPNGEVFHAGPSAQMHWINTTGNGTITSAGNRGDDPYAMTGDAQLYDVGLIMKTGGSPAYQDANAEANTYIININNGTSGVTVTKVAPMAYPRAFANGVVLPNGEVVIIGGQTYPVPFSDATAILIPEIWNPVTRVFRQMNAMATPRVYHSTGILLPDGRVYEGGGGQCGEGCSANHFNTEILTPPYLLNSDGSLATRPVIDYASSTAVLGGTITATTASPVVSFVLMRLSSTTHTVNNDQRRIPLQMASTSGDTYTLTIPNNPGIVLPGYYWLFALNAQGVPSVAAVVLIS